MDTIAEFVAALSFEIDLKPIDDLEKKAKGSLDGVSREADKVGKHIGQQIGSALKKIGTAFAAVGIAGAAALGGLVIHGVETAKALDVAANKLGLTTTELQRLEQAAMATDGSSEAMRKTIQKLREGLGELAITGGGPAKDTLGALGLSLTDLANIPVEQQLGKIGDALNLVRDPAERVSLTMRLLGEDGLQLQTTLAGGTAGIVALGNAAQRSGNVMDASLVKSAVRVEDQMRVAKQQIAAAGLTIFEQLLPAVEEMTTGTSDWVAENEDLLKQDLPDLMRSTAQAAGALVSVLASIARGLSEVRTGFQKWRLEVADSDGWVGDVDRTILGWQGKERNATGEIVDFGTGRSKFNAQSRADFNDDSLWENTAEFDRSGVNVDPAANSARVQAQVDAMRAQAAAAGGAAIRRRRQKDRAANALKAPTGGGGGGPSFSEDIGAGEFEFEEQYGDELRRLAERYGVGGAAVDASIKAGAAAVASGDTPFLARNAALSRLGSSAGVDLTVKRQTDPLLSQIFGDENVPDVELSSIARGAEPQVLISNITNNFDFKIEQNIDGAGDPAMVGDLSGRMIRDYFQGAIAQATRTAKVAFAR